MANQNGLVIRQLGPLVEALRRYGQQLYKPPDETIRGVEPNTWYSPLQPVKPMGPAGIEPRGFQYWAGQNLLWTPRADAEYSAADLKQLSTYPLARVAIENVKDILCEASWEIQPRPEPGEPRKSARKRGIGDKELVKVNRFFERPDREHEWPFWLRPLLEDMLVIDAWTILIRKTYKGEVVELPVLRGESIVRYIDENGFTPMPPEPAYAQNWWGIPLVNLSTDQLVYKPRNIVPRNTIASQLYGMSPTEQLAEEIAIGQARLAFIKAYYTEGSIPGVVHVVPRGTPPAQISEAMQWMNSELAGNLAARRQWRLVQGFNEPGKPDQIEFTKEPLLADAFDEMHIRKIAFGYGISPQRLMRMMNRASAEASQKAADIEGVMPYFASTKSLLDCVIQQKMGRADYEIVFDPFVEPDSAKETERVKSAVAGAILTMNEAREKLGEEKYDDPVADELGVMTGSGFIPIGEQAAQLAAGGAGGDAGATQVGAGGKKPTGDEGDNIGDEGDNVDGEPTRRQPTRGGKPVGGGTRGSDKPNGNKLAVRAQVGEVQKAPQTIGFAASLEKYLGDQLAKRRKLSAPREVAIRSGRLAPQSILARVALEQALNKHFRSMCRRAVKALAEAFDVGHAHLSKARKFDSVQFNLSPDDAARVLAIEVDDADWAEKGRELEPHVTVFFGLDGVTVAGVEALTRGTDEVEAVMGELEAFPEGEHGVPLVIRVESEALVALHDKLAALPHTDTHPEYKPHVCVGYLKPGEADKYVKAGNLLEGEKIVLCDLVFSFRDKTVLPLAKLASEDEALRAVLTALRSDWESIAADAETQLLVAAEAGASLGGLQLEITAEGMLIAINEVARDWAASRAAELVGMRRLTDGTLVLNPKAKWAITDTTRDALRTIIKDVFDQTETRTLRGLEDRIEQAGIFSDTRATMIARTEVSRAQTQGNLLSWRTSGLVRQVGWKLSAMHDVVDECDEAEQESPYAIDDVPELPLHPNCECALVLIPAEAEAKKLEKRWVTLEDGRRVDIQDETPKPSRLDLSDSVGDWCTSIVRTREIRKESERLIKSSAMIDPTKNSSAHVIIAGIRNGDKVTSPIYRGVGVAKNWMKDAKVGDKFQLVAPHSFTLSQGVAKNFAETASSDRGKMGWIIQTKGATRGIRVGASSTAFPSEREVITNGRFKITSIMPPREGKFGRLVIRQEGVF